MARLEADAIKGTALARLHAEASTISASAKLRFTASLEAMIRAKLQKVWERYMAADKLLEGQIGFLTPRDSAWQSWWNNQEARAKVFQEKIEKTMADASIPAARERLGKELEAALVDAVVVLYTETRAKFNTILSEAIAERGRLGPVTPDLMKELVKRIDYTGPQMTIKDGVLDPAKAQSLPTTMLEALGGAALSARDPLQAAAKTAGCETRYCGGLGTHNQSYIMQNPMTYLDSPLGKSAQEQAPNDRLMLTWVKRDFASLTLDAIQDQLLLQRMTTAEDRAQFTSALAAYAGYVQYVGTLHSQLDHLSGGPFTDDAAITSHRDAVLDDALSHTADQEIAAEVPPLIAQWQAVLSASPSPWVQRLQQSMNPLQLVKDEGHAP